MLPLSEFELIQSETIREAVDALVGPPGFTMVLAGGTDLLPNLKHGLFEPKRLISLAGITELHEVRETPEGGWFVGAGVTLRELAAHPIISRRYPALTHAAGLVAGPQIRNAGTLGGNLCLDTRCAYYNQTRFWRQALGFCIKTGGDRCHVVPEGSRCVAAHSADTPGPLLTYGATVNLASAGGERQVLISDFFRPDGISNTVKRHNELLTGVALPPPKPGLHAAYEKLRIRNAIDFPVLSVTVSAVLEDSTRVKDMHIVVSGLGAKPRVIRRVGEVAMGNELSLELIDRVGRLVFAQCHPMPTTNVDSQWRRNTLPTLVHRAFRNLKPSETS